MFNRFIALFCMLFIATTAWSQTEVHPTEPAVGNSMTAEDVDEVLVIGEQPGPGLWKVFKDDHVLWILGTYSPLPKEMTWRSQHVESILANAQEFITPPDSEADLGFFKAMTLLPSLIGIKKNPDGAHLQDVLPADVYARWLPLKEKYIGSDKGIEKERPIFASQELFHKAIDKVGLTGDASVWKAVNKIVKKNKVKTTSPVIKVNVDKPGSMIKKFKNSTIEDVECFTTTIDRLEKDLDAIQSRANAWAVGDLNAMRTLTYPDQDAACVSAFMNSSVVKELEGMQSMMVRMQEAWVAAIEKALATNQLTFAVLPISELLKSNGYLSALKEKGYEVIEPK